MQTIRVTEQWQRSAVHYLRIKVSAIGLQIPLAIEFDEHDGEQTNYMLLLDDNTPVATARLHFVDEKTAKIERVCVSEEYQGKGYGRCLMQATEAWASVLDAEKIVVTSKADVVGFYEKLGYTPNYNIIYNSFIPIVYTEKQLKKEIANA